MTKWLIKGSFLLGVIISLNAVYMPAKAILAQVLLLDAWHASKQTGNSVKPWPWADTEPVGKLIFQKQKEEFIVLAGGMGRTLAFAPGHLTGSALPEQNGHIVISAHRDSHFSILAEVTQGDKITLESRNGHIRHFRITSRRVVDVRQEPLSLDFTANILTLLTCYPFDNLEAGGPFRLRLDAVEIASRV